MEKYEAHATAADFLPEGDPALDKPIKKRPRVKLSEWLSGHGNRLGPGEYYFPSQTEPHDSQKFVRSLFLCAVAEHAAEVIEELYTLDPLYAELMNLAPEGAEDGTGNWAYLRYLAWTENPEHVDRCYGAATVAFCAALKTWAVRHGLDYPWAVGPAYGIVFEKWRGYFTGVDPDHFFGWPKGAIPTPQVSETQQFKFARYGLEPEITLTSNHEYASQGRSFSFVHGGWDPTNQSRTQAKEHIRKRFEQALEQYFADLDRKMLDDGYRQTDSKWLRSHFYMAVDRRVRDHTWNRISNNHGCSVTAAIHAVQSIEGAMGVPRSVKPRGRPPKMKQR